jgi:hypothetical protein
VRTRVVLEANETVDRLRDVAERIRVAPGEAI